MTTILQQVGTHLEQGVAQHPERTFITLVNSHSQFSVDALRAELGSETEYWVKLLASLADGTSFLQALESIRHIFDALKHEDNAMKDVTEGVAAQSRGEWNEAANYYCNAMGDLNSAHFSWSSAIHEIADDTPFDSYLPPEVIRQREGIKEPSRSSYADMSAVAPNLFRIHSNIDRTFCIGQELVQRQITCLTNYMHEAEALQSA